MHDHGLIHDLAVMSQQAADRRRALRWLSAGGLAGVGVLQGFPALGQAIASDADTVLNYAESAYAAWFPGPQANRTGGTFTYRYYPTTGNYLGVSSGRVYVLGPLFGNTLIDVGAVADFVAIANGTANAATCSIIPEETAGPYPGDGSNGLNSGPGRPGDPNSTTTSGGTINALSLSGIVRSDIRSSVAGVVGTAAGIPMTVKLKLVNTSASCASLSGFAIYLWHCTRDGLYSMYSTGVTEQNFLRGVQPTDSTGTATFTTIFPGCYDGRVPHMHFEIFRSVGTATSASGKIKTSQLTFPASICQQAYAADGYATSLTNLSRISLATDNIFNDGYGLQMASITGDNTNGYVATLQIGVAA
jgi:protocatechuate 3,4-dioxygenase beta subunit